MDALSTFESCIFSRQRRKEGNGSDGFKPLPFPFVPSLPCPALSRIHSLMGPETVIRKTWGWSHKKHPPSLSLSHCNPFLPPAPQVTGLGTASPLWKTSSKKDKMPDLCLKANTMYLEITCFQEIQNNLLKVMPELANFSFRVTCLY